MPYITSVERLGMKQGRQEGLQEGRQAGLREAIAIAVEAKFGEPGHDLLGDLEKVTDEKKLTEILERVLRAADLKELADLSE